jgi:glutamate-1-semialdehyde 2,1-aminomutase
VDTEHTEESEEFLLPRSRRANERLHAMIPGGAHTYAKGDDQYPENLAPVISHGRGAHVWDIDGNRYIEYGSGLRSVSLGHAHPRVIEAVRRELDRGGNFVRPSVVEVEAAERFLATVPTAEMVKFAKNGSDATTAAVEFPRRHRAPAGGRLRRPSVLLRRRLVHRHHADVRRHPGGDHRTHPGVPLRGPGRHGGTAHPAP